MRCSVVFVGLLVAVTALDNGLGQRPPMGWNSWNSVHCGVTGALLESNAELIVKLGLADAGYTSVNTDDCWLMKTRSADGKLQPAPTFGSIDSLVSKLKSMNLTFGIYAAMGLTTCASRAGSLFHEVSDAQQYADWGVTYAKVDNCGEVNLNSYSKFSCMRDALNATGSPIYYSTEPHLPLPISWTPFVANAWRTGGDIGASYSRMLYEAVVANAWAFVAGPSAQADADMLEIGNTGLSVPEARTHMVLWCLLKSPLLIGTDLNKIQQPFLDILLNKGLIALNQDPLGKMGYLRASMPVAGVSVDGMPDIGAMMARVEAAQQPGRSPSWSAATPVTECEYTNISAEQQWEVDASSLRQGGTCLTVSSGSDVTVAPCLASGNPSQSFQGVDTLQTTLSQLRSATNDQCVTVNVTKATNQPALFLSECEVIADDCYHSRCANVNLTSQLFYLSNRTRQVSSAFTNSPVTPLLDVPGPVAPNIPLCLATAANTNPPPPPQVPPTVNASNPLQVWAVELEGGDVGVALVNADKAHTHPITASWADVGLPATVTVTVTDLINNTPHADAKGSLTVTVGPHDVAAFRLSPKTMTDGTTPSVAVM